MNNNIRRKILRYESIKIELEEAKILSKEYYRQFIDEIFPEQFDNLTVDNSSIQNNNTTEPILTENLKKIYRKLSLKLHPDRNINLDEEEKKETQEIFQEITQSYENGDFCNLLIKAREYRIKIPELLPQDIEILENNIKEIEDNLENLKKQMSWIWCTTQNSAIKEKIKKQCKMLIEQSILFDWAVEETMECSICLVPIEQGKTEKRVLCGHIFHKHCIMSWFSIKFSCPLCRRSFE